MDELLARATQGVDPDAPGAFWHIFFNLLNMLPWAAMFWWSLLFVAVGALLGWWRGRLFEGIVWSWVLGRARRPSPPAPPVRCSAPRVPP